jgi:hypothetical protein
MSIIINPIGSFSFLKEKLQQNNIHDFASIQEVMDFLNTYSQTRRKILLEHEKLISEERAFLEQKIIQLDNEVTSWRAEAEGILNFELDAFKAKLEKNSSDTSDPLFFRLIQWINQWWYNRKISIKNQSYESTVEAAIKPIADLRREAFDRIQFITIRFDQAVEQSALPIIGEMDWKKRVLDEYSSFVYGAIGEQKVLDELEKLPDSFYVINDFSVSFRPGIFNHREKDLIQSIQVDHLLIGPAGVFILETKNWSRQSISGSALRSPVEQIRRFNYAIFRLTRRSQLTRKIKRRWYSLRKRKVPILNVVVMTNSNPFSDAQYVRMLTLDQLIGYIRSFDPVFTGKETRKIAKYFIELSNKKTMRLR